MTRKLTHSTSVLRGIAPFIGVLTVMIALAALAPIRGTTLASGKADVLPGQGAPETAGQLLFFAPVNYAAGFDPTSVAIADVNGDGKPDLLVADLCRIATNCPNSGGGMSVLLGNGDGTFQHAVTYDSGGVQAKSIAVADLNGDGRPDVVVANCSSNGPNACNGGGQNGSVGVFLGNGDGTFGAVVTYDSGGWNADSVAVADVNGDGKPDLLVANFYDPSKASGSVGVLLGNGNGTFQSAVTHGLNPARNISSIAVGDLNGDGKPDLVVTKSGSPDGVGVLLGNGDGTFQPDVAYDSHGIAVFATVADVNGDGKLDLLVANDGSNTAAVLLGLGNGRFVSPVIYSSGGAGAVSIAVMDVNGDGKPDFVVGNCSSGTDCSAFKKAVVRVFLGQGDNTFKGGGEYSAGGSQLSSMSSADVNGDGRPDLVVTNPGSVDVLLNASGFSQTAVALTTSGSPSYVGQPVTFTAVVTSSNGNTVPDGELVTFHNGTAFIGSAMLSGGKAVFTTSSLSASTHSISATYAGDAKFLGSTGRVSQVVVKYTTATSLTSSLNPSQFGQAVTFTAQVTSTGPAPTGSVKFLDGTLAIGSATLSGGVAKLTNSTLAVGTHPITAHYLGDTFSAKSTSPVVNQVVQ
jgi:hypothetical protein